MRERERTLFPPCKKNWKPGQVQVGLFIRTQDGSKIEWVNDNATPEISDQIGGALGKILLSKSTKKGT